MYARLCNQFKLSSISHCSCSETVPCSLNFEWFQFIPLPSQTHSRGWSVVALEESASPKSWSNYLSWSVNSIKAMVALLRSSTSFLTTPLINTPRKKKKKSLSKVTHFIKITITYSTFFSCCLHSPGCLHLFPWEVIPSSQALHPCVATLAVQNVLPCPSLLIVLLLLPVPTLLGPFLVGGSVTVVFGGRRIRPKRSVVSVHLFNKELNTLKNNKVKTETVLSGADTQRMK